MAAELAYDAVTGRAMVFSVKETMWHREGLVLEGAPAYAEAMKLLRFDYPLEKLPYLRPAPGTPTDYVEAGDAFYIWRPDTQKSLGSVGTTYEVVSNLDAFRPLEPLVATGVLTLETGGVLRDGADAWLLGRWDLSKFGDTAREVFGDELVPYATVMANHNGRRGILLGQTPIRVVCANTLGAAERDAGSRWATINHVKGARERLVESAREMFSRVIERYEVIAAQYRLLQGVMLDPTTFSRLILDVVAPDPRDLLDWNPEAKMAESVVARCQRKRERLTDLWYTGKGHTGQPTAWFAYNGTVEALDFDRDLFPTRAGCYRTASLLTGVLADMKGRVLDGLVQYAQGA